MMTPTQLEQLAKRALERAQEFDERAKACRDRGLFRLAESARLRAQQCRKLASRARRLARERSWERDRELAELQRAMEGTP